MTNSLKLVDFVTGFKLLLFYVERKLFKAASKVPEILKILRVLISIAATFDVVLTELEKSTLYI